MVISGRKLARQIREEARVDVDKMVLAGHRRPHLSVVLVGENPASHSYVLNKTRAAADVGKKNTHSPHTYVETAFFFFKINIITIEQVPVFLSSFLTVTSHRNLKWDNSQAVRHQRGGVIGPDLQTKHRPSCGRAAGPAASARYTDTGREGCRFLHWLQIMLDLNHCFYC